MWVWASLRMFSSSPMGLSHPTPPSNDLADRLHGFHADELLVQAVVEVAQPVRVETELLQDGGVQVLHVEGVLHGGAAQLVGLADADAALDTAAGQPHREAVGVVVAPGA